MNRLALSLLACLAGAAYAAPAQAADFCVHLGGTCPPGTIDMNANLQNALNGAAAQTDEDTVHIGPGFYTGAFTYGGSGPAKIVGAGTDQTTIAGPESADPHTVLAAGRAEVSGLKLHVPGHTSWTGLSLDGGLARDVAVEGGSPTTASRDGTVLHGSSKLLASDIAMGDHDTGVEVMVGGGALVEDTTVKGGRGLRAFASAETTVVRRSTLDAFTPLAANGAPIEARETVLRGRGPAGEPKLAFAGCDSGKPALIAGDHLTMIGNGTPTGALVQCHAAGLTAVVTLENSIMTGVSHSFERASSGGGKAFAAAAFTDLHAGLPLATGDGATNIGDSLNVDPGFAADGEHLATTSPLVDAGAPGGTFEPFDRDGNARVSGERQDMGAYEVQQPAPPASQDPDAERAPSSGTGTSTGAAGDAGVAATPAGSPAGPSASGTRAVADAALLAELRRTLRGRHGRRYAHRFLLPGTLRIRWIARGRVIAQLRATRTAAGTARLRVRPTKAGRRLLGRPGRLRIVAKASFASAGRGTLTASRRTVLKRG